MVLFWCRVKQSQLRLLSNQLKRCYFQIPGCSLANREANIRVSNKPSWSFHKVGFEFGNHVRFFAAPVQVKPKYEEKDKARPRMNEQISAEYVRLVTDEGHGVVSIREALNRARRLEVDLVEVQPDGKPPVCKLMDYNKEMYIKQVKEKEQTKKKSELSLRSGALKEVRITCKIDKNDLQTKADTVRRLTERGYRVKCMAVGTADQDLGGLLSRLSDLIDDFSLVESGPRVEAKQAFVVVRHVKFGPLKKGPGKKKTLATPASQNSSQNPENSERDIDESDSENEEEAVESPSAEPTMKFAPETSNRYASPSTSPGPGPENRYATTRRIDPQGQKPLQTDFNRRGPPIEPRSINNEAGGSRPSSSYNPSSAPNPNNEVNRYKKGPNGSGLRENQAGFRR